MFILSKKSESPNFKDEYEYEILFTLQKSMFTIDGESPFLNGESLFLPSVVASMKQMENLLTLFFQILKSISNFFAILSLLKFDLILRRVN